MTTVKVLHLGDKESERERVKIGWEIIWLSNQSLGLFCNNLKLSKTAKET